MNITAPVTESELADFCSEIERSTAAYFAKHYDRLTPPRFYPDPKGRKYIRIVRELADGSGRSVHCFVERATGLIWKAATWKAPARNFPRGNIRTDRSYALRGT